MEICVLSFLIFFFEFPLEASFLKLLYFPILNVILELFVTPNN